MKVRAFVFVWLGMGFLQKCRKQRRPHELTDEEDNQQDDDRRNIDAAEIGQDIAEWTQDRFSYFVKKLTDRCDKAIGRIDDVERIEP